jgi:hypothetical protein
MSCAEQEALPADTVPERSPSLSIQPAHPGVAIWEPAR